jgi:microcystin-dependent protein
VSSIDSGQGAAGNVGPADSRPLNQQEYDLLQRLLSDPLSIPVQFKTWLVSFLETSDMTLPISAVSGLKTLLGVGSAGGGSFAIFPAGIIFPYGGDTAPDGTFLCDGSAYLISTHQRLFTAIGQKYAAGRPAPPAGSFYVPDMQERFPIGRGSMAGVNSLGQTEGAALGSRGPWHQHAPHNHVFGRQGQGLTPGSTTYSTLGDMSAHDVNTDLTTVGRAGSPQDGPGFIVLNFVIIA